MEYVSNVPKDVDNYTFEKIKKNKVPKGIFKCKLGKLYSIMDNMKGKVIEFNYYYKKSANKCLNNLAAKYSSWRYMPRRDISKSYSYNSN